MSYAVKLHPRVDRFLRKLPKMIHERICKKLKTVSTDPFRYLERYEGDDFYKLRIGEYRALIDVDMRRELLFVRHLDHRGRIYRR